jgi:hypothetical protein
MRVEFQETGMAMARFSLFFSEEKPHENDAQIKQYLEQNKLTPKRVFRVLKDGERFQVMHFGQCYLGQHLDNLCYAAEADPVEVGAEDRIVAHPGDNVPGSREE